MSGFWSRIRKGRLFQVIAVYAGTSWLILEVADTLRDNLGLPAWVFAGAFIVLLAGLVVVLATAWVQSHPLVEQRAAAEEVPRAWEFDASDLRSALRARRLPHLTWARALSGGAILLLLLFGFAGLYVVLEDRGIGIPTGTAEAAALPGIAVLPFELRGAGLETLREGIGGLLNANMDGFEGVRPIDSRTVMARWRERVPGNEADLAAALDVARATQARYAVVGEGARLGERVRLTATVYDLRDGGELGVARAEGPADSLAAIVDQLTVRVLTAVFDPGGAGVRPRYLAAASTSSPRALWAFLEGEERFRRADGPGAIAAYARAVNLDSTFALAHFRLSRAYAWTEWTDSAGPRHGELAFRYADRLPPREAALIRADYDRNNGRAEASLAQLESLARAYPDDAEIWLELGDTYFHLAPHLLLPLDRAAAAFDRAIALDSAFWPAYMHHIADALDRKSAADAQRLLRAYGRHGPTPAARLAGELAFTLVHGDSAAKADATAALDTIPPEALFEASLLVPFVGRHEVSGIRAILDALARRPAEERPPFMRDALPEFFRDALLVNAGRMREHTTAVQRMASALDDPGVAMFLPTHLLQTDLLGLPVPDDVLDRVLGRDSSLIGALDAANRGRWERHASVVARLRREAAAAPDALTANALGAHADVAEGLALWRRGRTAEAVELLENARRHTVGFAYVAQEFFLTNQYSRWFLARLLAEQGRYREALRYYASLPDPFSRFEEAEILVRLGEIEDARRAYADCLAAWHDADPDFSYAERARRALERLTRENGP